MRLLDISNFPQRVKFYEVADPRKERYAILSHVWDKDPEDQSPQEPTFQELSSIISAPDRLANEPRFLKLYRFCEAAHEAEYKLVWADMCCIDKTSSAELSEAIASMYYWYQCAEVCYAYLKDVPSPRDTSYGRAFQLPLEFRKSEWFTRDWHVLGSKCGGLTQVTHEITDVDIDVLTHKCPPDAGIVSRRMSWAAARSTTRAEDRAYSLMGLFGVQIPVIYGEREYAFIRLQEEILRRTGDPTLFAWGATTLWSTLGLTDASSKPELQSGLKEPQRPTPSDIPEETLHVRAQLGRRSRVNSDAGYLFASSPEDYQDEKARAQHASGGSSQASRGSSSATNMSQSRTYMRGGGPDSMELVPPNMVKMHGLVIPVKLAGYTASCEGQANEAADQRPHYLLPLGCTTSETRPIALLLSPGSDPSSGHHEYWVIGTYMPEFGRYCRIVTLPSPTETSSGEAMEFMRAAEQPANILLPSSIPMSACGVYSDGTTLLANPEALDISLAGWCRTALLKAGFSVVETQRGDYTTPQVYELTGTFTPKVEGDHDQANSDPTATLQIKIKFTRCSHPEWVVFLSGDVTVGPGLTHSGIESNSPSEERFCFLGGVKNHIPGEKAGGLWAVHGGVAVRSLKFKFPGRATNDADSGNRSPTNFVLKVRLCPTLSASSSASKNAAQSFVLEVEYFPEPEPTPVLAVGTGKTGPGDQHRARESSKGLPSSPTRSTSGKKS